MKEMTEKVGCPSFQSLRAKLSAEKVYNKNTTTATKPSTKGKTTKVETCRSLAIILNAKEKTAFDNLAKANATDLALLVELIKREVETALQTPVVEAVKDENLTPEQAEKIISEMLTPETSEEA